MPSLKRCANNTNGNLQLPDGPVVTAAETPSHAQDGGDRPSGDHSHVSSGDGINTTHIGDHTIVTTNLTSTLLVDDTKTSQAAPILSGILPTS